jgi:Sulfotransferase family
MKQPAKNVEPTTVKNRPKPVLMIPLRRCGSHALRLRLNASPDFYSPYPLHVVDFMPLVPLYGDLADDKNYFQMVVDIVGLQTASMVKWPEAIFDPMKVFEAIQNEPRSVHRIVWELLFEAAGAHHPKVVMDKSLDSVHYAEELMSLFDDMLFLNVVRDPRAQVASMNKAIIHDFDSGLNAATWLESYSIARNLAERFPQRVLTIRYEDFLANQEVVLKKICAFFGIAFLPSMLDVSQSSEAKDISKMSALWESNLSAPIAANIDKFKKSLSMEEIEVIETITGRYMDFYGYERMTPGQAKWSKSEQAEARKQSEEKKQKAWADLKEGNYKDYILRRFRIDYIQMVKDRLTKAKS